MSELADNAPGTICAVRGDDGLCDSHQRYLRSSSGCAQFEREGRRD